MKTVVLVILGKKRKFGHRPYASGQGNAHPKHSLACHAQPRRDNQPPASGHSARRVLPGPCGHRDCGERKQEAGGEPPGPAGTGGEIRGPEWPQRPPAGGPGSRDRATEWRPELGAPRSASGLYADSVSSLRRRPQCRILRAISRCALCAWSSRGSHGDWD